jgi:trimeric autotransporter adhesin
MTVTINGTTGLAGVDGSAGTPAIQGGDTNTGMFFPAADTIAFAEGGAEIARFDSSGNLGIGTSSPTLYSGYKTVAINGTTGGLVDFLSNGTLVGEIFNTASDFRINGASTYPIVFVTNGAERMRIDSSGNLLVGTTSVRAPLTVQTAPSNSAYGQIAAFSAAASDVGNAGISVTKYDNVTTTSQIFARFLVNQGATASGQINANGASAAAFGSYSDRRLKENIVDLPSQLDNIMALRTVEFDYIESEGGGHQIGFIAQEVQQIYPDLVGEREDGMLTLTDLNKNDARLIKCIQEQQALITALTARIEALEAK